VGTPFASNVPEDFWTVLRRAGELCTYQPGAALYRRGDDAEGIYLIQEGEVCFRFGSVRQSNRKWLQNAGSGTILALSEVMSGERHKLTAETATDARIWFVPRDRLMEFLRTTPLACMQVVRLLSNDLHRLYQTLREQSSVADGKTSSAPSREAKG
jgi:CRP-like cAMP-binding protein